MKLHEQVPELSSDQKSFVPPLRESSSTNGKIIIEEIYGTSSLRAKFGEILKDFSQIFRASFVIQDRIVHRPPSASERIIKPFDIEFEKVYELYKKELMSLSKVAEIYGLYYDEMLEEIKKRGLKLFFGPRTLEEAKKEDEHLEEYLKKLREG